MYIYIYVYPIAIAIRGVGGDYIDACRIAIGPYSLLPNVR